MVRLWWIGGVLCVFSCLVNFVIEEDTETKETGEDKMETGEKGVVINLQRKEEKGKEIMIKVMFK